MLSKIENKCPETQVSEPTKVEATTTSSPGQDAAMELPPLPKVELPGPSLGHPVLAAFLGGLQERLERKEATQRRG